MTYSDQTKRGMVIMSALINFVDWLSATELYPFTIEEKDKGMLVREFLASHSEGKNYFMQAEDIASRLEVPFKRKR